MLQAMATHFALAGARTVIISGRNPSTLHQARLSIKQRAPNCEVVTHEADVTDSTSVMQLFDNLPRVPDIVINNAGSQQSKQRLCETEPVEWWLDFVSDTSNFPCFTTDWLQTVWRRLIY